jgi:hypothetical protein
MVGGSGDIGISWPPGGWLVTSADQKHKEPATPGWSHVLVQGENRRVSTFFRYHLSPHDISPLLSWNLFYRLDYDWETDLQRCFGTEFGNYLVIDTPCKILTEFHHSAFRRCIVLWIMHFYFWEKFCLTLKSILFTKLLKSSHDFEGSITLTLKRIKTSRQILKIGRELFP